MKNIGKINALYPTPVTIVGTKVEEKINWINIAHVGIIGINEIILSINKVHYSNSGIKKNKTLSINLVNEEMLVKADYVGIVSGKTTDKSAVFEYFNGELENAPLIKNSPIAMECKVIDIYETETHDNFIVTPVNTYVQDEFLSEDGSIDYEKAKPILFEMPNKQYLTIEKSVGKCWGVGKEYKGN